jgi:acyl-CoA synthetase (AMP-forming)/AMP-acid ligase II
MTEASPRVSYLGPDEVLTRPGCAGRALPGVTIEILASDGLPVPRGGIGEVAVRGPNVMKGYVSGDEGRVDAEGRLRTGDLGRLDTDGYLYLVGRQSDLIKSAGERIFPREIEEVLDRHPDVLESAVLGVPDPVLSEKLVALVQARPGRDLDAASVKAHALRWLPFVRTPREVHVVAALPKTASAKVDRAKLKAALEAARRSS